MEGCMTFELDFSNRCNHNVVLNFSNDLKLNNFWCHLIWSYQLLRPLLKSPFDRYRNWNLKETVTVEGYNTEDRSTCCRWWRKDEKRKEAAFPHVRQNERSTETCSGVRTPRGDAGSSAGLLRGLPGHCGWESRTGRETGTEWDLKAEL